MPLVVLREWIRPGEYRDIYYDALDHQLTQLRVVMEDKSLSRAEAIDKARGILWSCLPVQPMMIEFNNY